MFLTSIALGQGPIVELGELPQAVSETSGLLFFNNRIITHNDSGGAAALFEIDTLSREITRTITITNATNTDWEAISQDEDYIYVGDFGNNLGIRQDLTIYRVAKADYLDNDTATAEAISFSYEDQTDFSDTGNSDWDAEAFFVLEDEFIILTKQWKSEGSVAYAVPKTLGNHTATRRDTAENIGLITDADYNATDGTLLVLGYSNFLMPFARIYSITAATIFPDEFTAVLLEIGLAQVEGVTHDGLGNYFISSELFTRQSPNIRSLSRLFKFSKNEEVEPEPEPAPEPEPNPLPEENEEELLIFNAAGTGEIRYVINSENNINGTRIYDINGKTVWEHFAANVEKEGIVSQHIATSIYYFVVYFDNSVRSKAFAVY
jgi:hypothetical protein